MYAPRRRYRYRARAPFTMGGLGVVGFLGSTFVGFWGADTLHRWAVTLPAGTAVPAGFADLNTYNSVIVDAPPGWKSLLYQGLLAIGGFALGGILKPTWAKILFFGVGVGATTHAAWQLANAYIILPMLGTSAWGTRAYAHELASKSAVAAAAPSTTSTTTTTTTTGTTQGPPGSPVLRGAPPVRVLPAGQPARMPTPLATQRPLTPAGTLAAPAGNRPFGMGQGTPPTPPPGMVQVANLANGNCPPGSQTVVNPDNLDMPFCFAPGQQTPPPPVTNTPPPPPPPPPPLTTSGSPNGGGPAFTNAPVIPQPLPGCAPCATQTVSQSMLTAAAGPPAGPLPGSGMAPCCGTAPCSCGTQSSVGAPPNGAGKPPLHPLFAELMFQARPRAA